jgi:tetratricopeptide (TPR) repeat protein
MKHILSILLFLFTLTGFVRPQELSPKLIEIITLGIDESINNRFVESEARFRELIQQYPAHPVGYFYTAATIQAQMMDAEDYRRQPEFEALIDSALKKAEILHKSQKSDAWIYFIEGSAYLYRSFVNKRNGQGWGAYRNAVNGVKRLEKALEIDSLFYDAYMGIGSYKYWKSSKTKGLTWLPFLSDEREKGIAMVKKAIDRGQFVKAFGRDQLAWILIDAKRFEEAAAYARTNCRLYPQSRFFKWTLVEVYYRGEQYDKAYPLYEELLAEISKLPDNNHYNETDCLLKLANIDCLRGEYLRAEERLNQLFSVSIDQNMRQRLEKRFKKALELQRLCREELAGTR